MEDNRFQENSSRQNSESNKDLQGVDKAPGEETGKGEKITTDDLKGKKNDGNPEDPFDQPIRQLP